MNPCPGNNTCCNRHEFDRALFPCPSEGRRIMKRKGDPRIEKAGQAAEKAEMEFQKNYLRALRYLKKAEKARAAAIRARKRMERFRIEALASLEGAVS